MDEKIFFIHVPKTGGYTIRCILMEQYSIDNILTCAPKSGELHDKYVNPIRYDQLWYLDEKERKNVKVVMGHFPYQFGEYGFKNVFQFTILRDPVERIISLYYAYKRSSHPFAKRIFNEINTLEEFVKRDFSNNNIYVKYMFNGYDMDKNDLSITERFKNAEYNLKYIFNFVGITEYFDESIIWLSRLLGWDNFDYYKSYNRNKMKLRDLVTLKDIKLIRLYNSFDIELYERIKEQFEQNIPDSLFNNVIKLKKNRRLRNGNIS